MYCYFFIIVNDLRDLFFKKQIFINEKDIQKKKTI